MMSEFEIIHRNGETHQSIILLLFEHCVATCSLQFFIVITIIYYRNANIVHHCDRMTK